MAHISSTNVQRCTFSQVAQVTFDMSGHSVIQIFIQEQSFRSAESPQLPQYFKMFLHAWWLNS